MEIDPRFKLANAIYQSPKQFACFFGSGLSYSVDMPNAWEISIELVNRIAQDEIGQKPEKPQEWFEENFGPLSYSNLLEQLTDTAEGRQKILKEFIEPSPEERERNQKTPGKAHKAIATLVDRGYINVIITTNFDRLIEQSLRGKEIEPKVYRTPDDFKKAEDFYRKECAILKLNGDYLDPDPLNTEDELSSYSDNKENIVRRIRDEFGLLICGWSAKWDHRLVEILSEPDERRFPAYWLTYRDLENSEQELAEELNATIIHHQGASEILPDLQEKVISLDQLNESKEMSAKVAAKTIQRYLDDRDKTIRIQELFRDELESLIEEIQKNPYEGSESISETELEDGFDYYLRISRKLTLMLNSLCFYDSDQQFTDLVEEIVSRLANVEVKDLGGRFDKLTKLPALLVIYSAGIVSLYRGNPRYLKALLTHPTIQKTIYDEAKDLFYELNPQKIFNQFTRIAGFDIYDVSSMFQTRTRPLTDDYIPRETNFVKWFDRLEYLITLTSLYDYVFDPVDGIPDSLPREADNLPVGNYISRYRSAPKNLVKNFIVNEMSNRGDGIKILYGGRANLINLVRYLEEQSILSLEINWNDVNDESMNYLFELDDKED